MNQKVENLKGKLIVSCQALPDEPLHSSFIMGRMALAAKQGGAISIGQTLSRLSPRATPCKQLSLHTAFHGISLYC